MKKFITFVLMLMSVLVFIGCKDDPKKEVLPESIEITSDSKEVKVGETLKLEAKVLPSNATNKNLTWSSSDEKIATVSKSGKVTGKAKGEVVITAVSKAKSDVSGEITINVTAPTEPPQEEVLPESIKITPDAKEVEVGETLELKAEVLPSNATNKALTWLSSNEEIATVSESGLVTAVAKGEVVITVSIKDTDIKEEITIKVVEAGVIPDEPAEKISITGQPAMEIGESMQLHVTFVPEGSNGELIWSSSNEEIATVSESGLVTAVDHGDVVITASIKDTEIKATRKIIVNDPDALKVETIIISADETRVLLTKAGKKKIKLSAVCTPVEAENRKVIWSSSDEEIATVSENGWVTPVSEGKVTITATTTDGSDKSATKEIEVAVATTPEKYKISTMLDEDGLKIGRTTEIIVNTEPEDGDDSSVFSSSDEEIATVSEDGIVTALSEGEVTISATSTVDETLTDSVTFKVYKEKEVKTDPTSIIIQGEDEVYVGFTISLKSTVVPGDAVQSVIWESLNEELATIDATGIVTALKAGTARIRCTSAVDPKVKATHRIKITVEPEGPAPSNMGGYEIVIMNADSAIKDNDPFLKTDEGEDAYKGSDKIYKQQAWRKVEEDYNCKIVVKAYPASAPWGDARIIWLNDNASAGISECDIAVVSSNWLPKFAQADTAAEVTDYYKRYGKKQMEPTAKEAGSYKGKLYSVSTGINSSSINVDLGLFYNYGKVLELGIDDPAHLFNNDQWNYTGFKNWVMSTQAKLGEDEYVLGGHPYYYYYGMTNAAGVKIADANQVKVNINSPRSKAACALIAELHEAGCTDGIVSWAESDGGFKEQKTLMTTGCLWFVGSDNRWKMDMFGEDTKYGYVPFPYPDDVAKTDTRIGISGLSIMMYVKGRNYPAGVSLEDVYRAVNDMFLNTIKLQKEDPMASTGTESLLQKRFANEESIAALKYYDSSRAFYDCAHAFYGSTSGTHLKAPAVNVMYKGKDFDTEFDGIFNDYSTAFKKVYG